MKTKEESKEHVGQLNIKRGGVIAITVAVISVLIMVSCNTSADKVENTENEALETEQSLEQVNAEYFADVKNYRIETREQIEANNQRIAEFNVHNESNNKEVQEEYKKQIDDLERKNSELEKRMDNYKADSREDWQLFKKEFDRDLDELSLAFKNFGTERK